VASTPGLFQPLHLRRQNLSDGSRVHVTVGVAANTDINRAMVQAGPTADTQQRLAQFRIGQDFGTTVVER
jgi:hypothetical protein